MNQFWLWLVGVMSWLVPAPHVCPAQVRLHVSIMCWPITQRSSMSRLRASDGTWGLPPTLHWRLNCRLGRQKKRGCGDLCALLLSRRVTFGVASRLRRLLKLYVCTERFSIPLLATAGWLTRGMPSKQLQHHGSAGVWATSLLLNGNMQPRKGASLAHAPPAKMARRKAKPQMRHCFGCAASGRFAMRWRGVGPHLTHPGRF